MEIIKKNPALPYATAVLVLGILSVVLSCLGIGIILGLVAMILSHKGKQLNALNPGAYYGYTSIRTGRIMSIIGMCISGLMIFYYLFWGLFIGTMA